MEIEVGATPNLLISQSLNLQFSQINFFAASTTASAVMPNSA